LFAFAICRCRVDDDNDEPDDDADADPDAEHVDSDSDFFFFTTFLSFLSGFNVATVTASSALALLAGGSMLAVFMDLRVKGFKGSEARATERAGD